MKAKKTIIVVGGAHGGPSAVARARQAHENARIILVEQAPSVMWVQASVRTYLASSQELISASSNEKGSYFQKRYNVEVHTDTRAISLDLDAKILVVEHKGRAKRMPFDSLIFAGGATSKELEIPNLSGARVAHFRSLVDAAKIRKAINEGAKKAAVIGCGFYGVDAALGLRDAGISVTVVESKRRIMPYFSSTFAEAIVDKLRERDITLYRGTTVVSAEGLPNGGFELELSQGEKIQVDLVIVCIGISPRTGLLADAGAALDPEGLVRVDDHMATTLPNVFACGSAVSVPYAITHERRWFPQPAIVIRTAHIAGFNAAIDDFSRYDRLKPSCGTIITEVGDTLFARTGLQEHEARLAFGDDNVFVTTVFGSAAESLVYEHEMCVKLLVAKVSNRVVGGEVFGKNGVLRRIDLIGVAVLEGWPPEKLIDLDMAYLANSGPAFDPLKDAAMRAKRALVENDGAMTAERLALWLANNRNFRLVDVGEKPLLSCVDANTMHLPLENLRERLDELKSVRMPIVLFSKSGHRSYLAQVALKQRGLNEVYHLDGGVAVWNLLAPKE